jgi:hypothetical protein
MQICKKEKKFLCASLVWKSHHVHFDTLTLHTWQVLPSFGNVYLTLLTVCVVFEYIYTF